MPKRGSLKSAGKRQESATFLQRSFSRLHCSFSLAAAQLLVKMTSAPQKGQCCSATSAAQHPENCSVTSVFACGMLQGRGLEGRGLGLAEISGPQKGPAERATSKNVKNRQKVSKICSTLFDIFRAGQKTSRIVKKCQNIFDIF